MFSYKLSLQKRHINARYIKRHLPMGTLLYNILNQKFNSLDDLNYMINDIIFKNIIQNEGTSADNKNNSIFTQH